MAFDNLDNDIDDDEENAPEESSNRPFFVILGILGAIFILALLGVLGYLAFLRPQMAAQQAQSQAYAATVNSQNTQVALTVNQTATQLAFEAAITPTFTNTPVLPPTATSTPTSTPVLVQATNTGIPTMNASTATIAALQTQVANNTRTPNSGGGGAGTALPTSTGLPNSGFADEVGLPLMLGMAGVLLVVIFLARRLRTA